jgi:hypothetical protein
MVTVPGANGQYDIHYGNRGTIGNTVNFDPDNNQNGLWIEGSHDGESGGIFMNGNTIVLWSPSDNGLLRIFDEDNFATPVLKIVGSDTNEIHQGETALYVLVDGRPTGTLSLQQVKLGEADSGGPGFRMLRVKMP